MELDSKIGSLAQSETISPHQLVEVLREQRSFYQFELLMIVMALPLAIVFTRLAASPRDRNGSLDVHPSSG